jgi:hypothetical protein
VACDATFFHKFRLPWLAWWHVPGILSVINDRPWSVNKIMPVVLLLLAYVHHVLGIMASRLRVEPTQEAEGPCRSVKARYTIGSDLRETLVSQSCPKSTPGDCDA